MNPFEQMANPILAVTGADNPAINDLEDVWPWPIPGEIDDVVVSPIEETPDIGDLGDGIFQGSTEANKASKDIGVEAYAFYKSIHLRSLKPFAGRWGIFVYDWSVTAISRQMPQAVSHDRIRDAWNLLRFHELYHFLVDGWILAQEESLRRPLFLPYLTTVYQSLTFNKFCVEESLANQFMIRAKPLMHIRSFMENFADGQPEAYRGYRVARKSLSSILAAQILRRDEWIYDYHSASRRVQKLPGHAEYMDFSPTGLCSPANCPTYLIRNVSPARLFPPLRLPDRKEVMDFVLRYLDGQPLGHSDHDYIRIDNGEKIRIPNPHGSGQLKEFEYRNIRLKAGMTNKEYDREWQRTNKWSRHIPRAIPRPSRLTTNAGVSDGELVPASCVQGESR